MDPPLQPPALHPLPLPEHGPLHLSELFQQPQVSCLSLQTPGCLQRCFLICRPHHLTPGSMVFLVAPVTINYQIEYKPLACSQSSSRTTRREGPGAALDDREVRTLLAFHKSVKIVKFAEKLLFNPCVRKIPWRRKWQSTLVFWPGEFHGQRSLAGCSP